MTRYGETAGGPSVTWISVQGNVIDPLLPTSSMSGAMHLVRYRNMFAVSKLKGGMKLSKLLKRGGFVGGEPVI